MVFVGRRREVGIIFSHAGRKGGGASCKGLSWGTMDAIFRCLIPTGKKCMMDGAYCYNFDDWRLER